MFLQTAEHQNVCVKFAVEAIKSQLYELRELIIFLPACLVDTPASAVTAKAHPANDARSISHLARFKSSFN